MDEDLSILQKEMNSLVNRRLEYLRKLKSLESEKSAINSEIKSVSREFVTIDLLMKEKLEEIDKLRQ